jgi:hypothetical protein
MSKGIVAKPKVGDYLFINFTNPYLVPQLVRVDTDFGGGVFNIFHLDWQAVFSFNYIYTRYHFATDVEILAARLTK